MIENGDGRNYKPCIKCGAQERSKRGDCLPCRRAYDRKYHRDNFEKRRESNRVWSSTNKDKTCRKAAKYREANREKTRESQRNWRESNPEANQKRVRRWTIKNRDKILVFRQNRRSRIKHNGGTLSRNIIEVLLVRQKRKCACCGEKLNGSFHLDHIIPLSLGGMNSDCNVQLLLAKCNLRKGCKHPIDYMQEKGMLL